MNKDKETPKQEPIKKPNEDNPLKAVQTAETITRWKFNLDQSDKEKSDNNT